MNIYSKEASSPCSTTNDGLTSGFCEQNKKAILKTSIDNLMLRLTDHLPALLHEMVHFLGAELWFKEMTAGHYL